MSYLLEVASVNLLNITANTTAVIPAGYSILQVIIRETAGGSITGGLKIGTTSGGVDVCAALTVTASSIQAIPNSQLLKSVFSASADTTLYLQAVTLWVAANISIHLALRKFT